MPLILLALLALRLSAAPAPALSKGFDHFYNLEYEAAIAEFSNETRTRPNDPFSYTHLAQAILYREMYKAGALESELVSGNNFFLAKSKILPPEAEQRRFEEAIASAIRLCEARIAANANDAEAIYGLGIAHGLRANYNFLIRKLWRDSLREFTESRKLHQRVVDMRPDFVDAMLVEGVHDYIVGSLPFTWKLLGFLIGFRGDKEGGLRTVERVAREGVRNRVDAMILLAVAYRRERTAERGVPLLLELIRMFPRNYLYRLELVQFYADQGKKEEALAVLRAMEQLKNSGAVGYKSMPAGKIHYSRGNLLFWYRDYAAAIPELRRVIDGGTEAGLVTFGNAWLRLGQCLDMQRQRMDARAAYHKAIDAAPDSDAAREARRYLNSAYRR